MKSMNHSVPTVLSRIAESVGRRLSERRSCISQSELWKALEQPTRRTHSFSQGFSGPGVHVLAELKYESPSEGVICDSKRLTPLEVVKAYVDNGAVAVSVLTEQDFFGGSLTRLSAIRRSFPEVRLLLKDFVIDEYQLMEARIHGADAALLIVSLLGEDRTQELLETCRQLELEALVEVHDEEELAVAGRIGARLIGVNNRNLKDLKVSLDVSRALIQQRPLGAVMISESGLAQGSELLELQALGYSGFLIGTSFMRSVDPGTALSALLREAR